jgi:hypothetical protein
MRSVKKSTEDPLNKIKYVSKQQKEIVHSESHLKLINGCAGSRKTDTLIKCGIYNLITRGDNLLFLTLISSVTNEIKTRIESMLKIRLLKHGNSNHYMGIYANSLIEVANFDAWTYKQLEVMDEELLGEVESSHHARIKALTELVKKKECGVFYMKNNTEASCVLIDEFQDIDSLKVNLLIKMYENAQKKKLGLSLFVVGDILQSVFEKTISQITDSHPMNTFKLIKPNEFELSKCFRCPRAHIDFCNLLLEPAQKKYNVKPIEANNSNQLDKPLLFLHGSISENNNLGAKYLSNQVVTAISVLFDYEGEDLKPDDIAIIMVKSNQNAVFEYLRCDLESFYKTKGFSNAVKYFETHSDGYHMTLDWTQATGKTILLSVHGDKGKGHRVVFFLGLSNGSIPREDRVGKIQELIDYSLLNVALTRSTEYLFVGINQSAPSTYLNRVSKELHKYAYCAWGSHLDKIPNDKGNVYRVAALTLSKIFKQICKNNNPLYIQGVLPKSESTILNVKEHVSKVVEDLTNILDSSPEYEEVEFGTPTSLKTHLNDDTYKLIGYMGELMIYRAKAKNNFNECLENYSKEKNIFYSDNEEFIALATDFKLNELFVNAKFGISTDFTQYLTTVNYIINNNTHYFLRRPQILEILHELIKKPRLVVHGIFNRDAFRDQLKEILSNNTNSKIPTQTWWNITLFWNDVVSQVRKPALYTYINLLSEDISGIHQNISKYLGEISDTIAFQDMHYIECILTNERKLCEMGFSKKKNPEVFMQGYQFGIRGTSDIYDFKTKTLIEIKTSHKKDMSNEWIIQAFMYYAIPGRVIDRKIPEKIQLMNVMTGKMYVFKLNYTHTQLLTMMQKLLKYLNIHPHIISCFIDAYDLKLGVLKLKK